MERNIEDNNPRKSSYKSCTTDLSSSSSVKIRSYNNNYKAEKVSNNATRNPSSSKVGSSRVSLQEKHGDPNDFSNVQPILGTCPFMCPEKERSQRELLRDLATFERLYGNPSKSSSTLAVKKFCRTISTKDVQATDLRPLPVLEDTLNYLISLLDSSEQPFEVVHDFIFDRTRSIRQDLSMQNIYNRPVIDIYEKIVKFHVVSHYKLRRCEGDSTIISSIHYLNREQLTKCLASLYNHYDVNRTSSCIYDHEAEFRSLYVLLHLDSQSHSTVVESLSLWLSRLPCFIIKSKKMCFARSVLRFYQIGNFWRFFRVLAAEATCLQLYIIEPYISQVWGRALECINYSGYKLHPYPLSNLSKSLMIKELDLEAFCNACGLVVSEDDMGNKVLPTKQTSFCYPKYWVIKLIEALLYQKATKCAMFSQEHRNVGTVLWKSAYAGELL
ncbi:hypothetical protein KSS87_010607 [Heliosperma pusillum]|nr:hypothetical protein KSS87_010607 [Heliosperma pusillum]